MLSSDMALSNAERRRRYYANNREKVLAKNARTRKALRQRARAAVLQAYGEECACCGEKELVFLTLDHVNGGGNADRRMSKNGLEIYRRLMREGFPPGYQILCWNCNAAKHFQGICPHQNK